MGKQPVKRQREPSPPSSESEASDVSEHEDGGLPIPLLDLAIISDLRKREIEGPLATLKQHASMYREVHRKWRTHVTDYVAQSVGPSVTAEINKSGECPFYTMVMENAFRMGEEFVQSKSLKLTSLAMNNEHAQGAYGKKDSITPFQVSDIMPNVRFDDGDELFANQIRGVTIEYLLDEATKDAGAYHATQYEFHFVKDAKKPFSNTSLKVRFITLGGYFYRQATLTLGRIVDVQADSVEWTDKATKEEFLKNSAPFSLFRVLFCNTLPKIPEGKFVVPASSIAAHGIVEQYLGSTASLPNSDINMVDVEVLHRQFPVDGKGIVFPRASEAKPNEKGNGYVAAKLAKYLDIIRKTSVVAQRTKEADLDVVRLVVLLNATLYYTVTTILFNIADNPVELSLQPPMDDDEEDEEGDEGDDEEGDEGDDEEDDGSDDDDSDAGVVPSKPTGPAPPKKAAPGKQQPECKQQ